MVLLRRIIFKVVRLNNWLLFWSTTTLILFSSFFISYIEPENFATPFIGLWWVMTTVTTVGYGDYSPTTVPGQLYAIFLYIFGIGLIGVVIGKVVDWFASFRRKREEGRLTYKGEKHIVIIGWSKKAEYAVDEILNSSSDVEVVVVDTLEKAPYLKDRVFYVRGEASEQLTLEQANIQQARAVLIFADDKIQDTQLADGKTLLIASSIEHFASDIHTTVEVLHENHIGNFRHVQVDEFVISHETISRLAVRAAFTKGISSVYSQLISRSQGADLYQISKKSEWLTYKDAFDALLQEGATLISDRDKLDINRRLNDNIPPEAKLFVVCDKETYLKIANH